MPQNGAPFSYLCIKIILIMKYRNKVKLEQKAVKVKGQKRRVVEQPEWKTKYTDEEIAQMTDYDYGYLLDMMYYKFERMVAFFNSVDNN